MTIYRYALKYIIAKSEKDFKKYIRQKIKNDYNNQLELSKQIGRINKIVKDKLKQIKSHYYRKVYDWLIDEKMIPQQDISKIVQSIKQYQIISKNTNDCPVFYDFNHYYELSDFIQDYKKDNASYQFQKLRFQLKRQPLPFKKINSNGKYDIYVLEEQDWMQFNELYGNNQNSPEGGLIATTNWCVALQQNYYYQYGAPYYLITDKSNNPQALIHLDSSQFKDVKDLSYNHNNKYVYQLVINTLSNKYKMNYNDELSVLLQYLSQQKKDSIYNEYIYKKDYLNLLKIIQKKLFPQPSDQLKNKITQNLILNKKWNDLFENIKNGNLFKLNNQQSEKIINFLIKNGSFKLLLSNIQNNVLPKLNDNQKDYLIKVIESNPIILDRIFIYESVLNFTKQQKNIIIESLINKQIYSELFKFINQGYLQNITDQQNDIIIESLINEQIYSELFKFINQGYLKNITDQQKQKIINNLIERKHFEYLFISIQNNNLPQLNNSQKNEIIKILLKSNDYNKLFDYIKKNYFSQLTNQQKKILIDDSMKKRNVKKILDFLKCQRINLFTQYQEEKILDQFVKKSDIFNIMSSKIIQSLTDYQKQIVIDKFFKEKYCDYRELFYSIRRNYLPQLTEYQMKKLIDSAISQKRLHQLFNILKFNDKYLLSDHQKQIVINEYLEESFYQSLFNDIKAGYLPQLTKQQNNIIIEDLIKKSEYKLLFIYIEKKYLPQLNDEQKSKINNNFI